MYVHLPLKKKIQAGVTGRRIVETTCEKCQTHFFYELCRRGRGVASAILFLAQEHVAKHSEQLAQENLAQLLASEVELVPCPQCNWVNQAAVEKFRIQRCPGSRNLAIFCGFLAIICLFVPFDGRTFDWPGITFGLLILLIPATKIFLITPYLRRRINPNQQFPNPPVLPTGTPPALVERISPDTLEPILEPVVSLPEPTDYAILHSDQFPLPPVCVRCLQPPTVYYSTPFGINEHSGVKAPLCNRCDRYLTVKWVLLALVSIVASIAIAGFIAVLPASFGPFGKVLTFISVGVPLTLIVLSTLPNELCRPYKFRTLDRLRGTFSFKAHDPVYTQLVIDWVREHESR
jgi:hypothetical protein